MKKVLALCLTAILSVGLFAGCGEGKDDSTHLASITVEDYITLGDYKNLTITATETVIEDSQVDYYTTMFYQGMISEENAIEDKVIEDGDYVYISFVGLLDGEAFEGGSGSSLLAIGSGQFIPGFEEQLIGAKPGDSLELNLTFPDDYTEEELQGKAVVFEVDVKYNTGAISDENISKGTEGEITTVEGYKEYVKTYLSESMNGSYEQQVENEILTQIVEGSTFTELPEEMLAKYKENMTANFTNLATQNGMDLATYCLQQYGMESEECITVFSENAVKQGLAFQAIANAENIEVTDEELNAEIEEMIAGSAYESVEDFVGESDIEEYREYFMFEEVLTFIKENCIAS